jgi:hypothetical protein
MSKIAQAAKTLDKEADKGLKKLDENTSKAIGMEEGHKISHTLNVDSKLHKEAVKDLKTQTSSEENKPEEAKLSGELAQQTDEG